MKLRNGKLYIVKPEAIYISLNLPKHEIIKTLKILVKDLDLCRKKIDKVECMIKLYNFLILNIKNMNHLCFEKILIAFKNEIPDSKKQIKKELLSSNLKDTEIYNTGYKILNIYLKLVNSKLINSKI